MQRDRRATSTSWAWRPVSGPRKLTGLAWNLDGVLRALKALEERWDSAESAEATHRHFSACPALCPAQFQRSWFLSRAFVLTTFSRLHRNPLNVLHPAPSTARLSRHPSPGRVVGTAGDRPRCSYRFPYLRDVGGVPERQLQLRPIPVAILLAGDLRRSGPCVVRSAAGLVAGLAPVLARPDHPPLPGALSVHLLLLPRRLLQGLLGRPSGMYRRRASQNVPR